MQSHAGLLVVLVISIDCTHIDCVDKHAVDYPASSVPVQSRYSC